MVLWNYPTQKRRIGKTKPHCLILLRMSLFQGLDGLGQCQAVKRGMLSRNIKLIVLVSNQFINVLVMLIKLLCSQLVPP
jgi:hypothetical protein